IAQDDSFEMQEAAHSLKSTSAAVGAMSLADLSQQLESIGRSHHNTNTPPPQKLPTYSQISSWNITGSKRHCTENCPRGNPASWDFG
ncbi:MAG TPA: Hpt domain-containing protein, partial [Vampirovibrionales bacterium]